MSQYTDAYLNENHNRGMNKGLTCQSFLAGVLKGRAKSYSKNYLKALERDLQNCISEGSVIPSTSAKGGTAYYRTITQDAAREEMRARLVGGVA